MTLNPLYPLFRSLSILHMVVLSCVMLAVPAWGQETASPELSESGNQEGVNLPESENTEERAKALIDRGRYVEALTILDPLVKERPVHANILFLAGLASMGAAGEPGMDEETREKLLDAAIRVFRALLVEDPGLVRVRLELGRAFFLKGEDGLARRHFEAVLAGNPPAPVVANVNRFLRQMRARKRWTTRIGFAIAPDSNISSQSEERTIYIHGLPFQRDQEDLTESGVGVSVWGGAEYQHPLGPRARLRSGFDLSRHEYSGGEHDRMTVSAHAGPRWLIGNRSEASLLAMVRWDERANDSYSDEYGIRLEGSRRFGRRTTGRMRTYFGERRHDRSTSLDGPVMDVSVGMSHVLTPALRADLNIGWSKERPDREVNRNASRRASAGVRAALPRGFTLGGSVSMRWTDYDTAGPFPQSAPAGERREDLTRSFRVDLNHRGFTWRGFSPRLSLVKEERTSNAQVSDYDRDFAELSFVRLF